MTDVIGNTVDVYETDYGQVVIDDVIARLRDGGDDEAAELVQTMTWEIKRLRRWLDERGSLRERMLRWWRRG